MRADHRVDVSHGVSRGLAFALPWAIVAWLAILILATVLV